MTRMVQELNCDYLQFVDSNGIPVGLRYPAPSCLYPFRQFADDWFTGIMVVFLTEMTETLLVLGLFLFWLFQVAQWKEGSIPIRHRTIGATNLQARMFSSLEYNDTPLIRLQSNFWSSQALR